MTMSRLRPSFTFDKDRLADLLKVVPESFADGLINWTLLKEALGEWTEEEDQDAEHFGLSWPGKREARRLAGMPSRGTLVPAAGEGVNEEIARNFFIEGDNLEVLKLLQKSYAGKVKMIYIDPPYNTGNDFVYKDDFRDPLSDYLRKTGQVDDSGQTLTTNTRADGRFHSNWLSMMYPRLRLARNLLQSDGVLCVSIDDGEVHHLRSILGEIFGEENFLAQLVWDLGSGTAAGHFTRAHEYVLVFAKDKSARPNFRYRGEAATISDRAIKRISSANPASVIEFPPGIEFEGTDAVFSGEWGGTEKVRAVRGDLVFENGKLKQAAALEAGWAMREQILTWLSGSETFDTKGQRVTRFFFDSQGKLQYEKERGFVNPPTVLRKLGSTKNGSTELAALVGPGVFDYPKPVSLIQFLVDLVAEADDIVLDFFAGSCSTADAVLNLNAMDDGRRQFICVQLPEASNVEGFADVSEIGKARIRAKLKQISDSSGSTKSDGFKVLRLAESNFQSWHDYDGENIEQLEVLFADAETPLVKGWTPDALLTEILLIQGFPLDAHTESQVRFEMNDVCIVTAAHIGHRMWVCFDRKLDDNTIASLDPAVDDVFVCLDSALDDQAKLRLADRCTLETI